MVGYAYIKICSIQCALQLELPIYRYGLDWHCAVRPYVWPNIDIGAEYEYFVTIRQGALYVRHLRSFVDVIVDYQPVNIRQ